MERVYNEELDRLTQNALKTIQSEDTETLNRNNFKYLSNISGITYKELLKKTTEKIRDILNNI